MMPRYDYRCTHGHRWEDIHSIAECDEAHHCDECGEEGWRVPQVVDTIGAMPSKPIKVGGAEVEFTDNASYRRWQAENPTVHVQSRNSTTWQNTKDRIRNDAEKQAKALGWRDWDHKTNTEKQAQKKGLPAPKPPIVSES